MIMVYCNILCHNIFSLFQTPPTMDQSDDELESCQSDCSAADVYSSGTSSDSESGMHVYSRSLHQILTLAIHLAHCPD